MADAIFRTRVVADTAPFIRELRQLETRYNTFDLRLDLDGISGSTKALKTFERQAERTLTDVRRKVGKVVTAFKQLEAAIGGSRDNLVRLNRSFLTISKSATRVATNVDRAEDQIRQMASARNISALGALDQRFDQITHSLRATTLQTNRADRAMDRLGNRASSTSRFLSAAFFGTASAVLAAGFAVRAIAGVLSDVAKLNAEFDLLARRTAIISGATEAEAAKVRSEALRLGEQTIFTARQVAEAQAELAKAGFDTNEIIASTRGVIDLAAAGQVDLTTATLITARTLRGFRLEAEQAGEVADVLAATATSAAIGVTDIGTAIKFVAPLAAQAGISLEETAAAIGKLGDAGFVGGIAGRGLRRALVNIIAPSEKARDAMEALNIQFDPENFTLIDIIEQLEESGATATDVVTIFGARAGPQMAALLQEGSASLREYTDGLEAAGGTAQEIADEQLAGLQGAIIRLQSAWETLRIRFVTDSGLDASLAVLLDSVRGSLGSIENSFERIFEPIIEFLNLVELRLGPALSSFGGSIEENLIQILEDGFDYLLNNGGSLLEFIEGFLGTLTDAFSVLLDVANIIQTVLPDGVTKFIGTLLALKTAAAAVTGIRTAIVGIGTAFDGVAAKAATFRAKAFVRTGLTGGQLLIGIAAISGAIWGISEALEAINRPSVISAEATRNLQSAFADAATEADTYADALDNVVNNLQEVRKQTLIGELQDDIDVLNKLAEELFAFNEDIVLPIVTLENLMDPNLRQEFREALNQIYGEQRAAFEEHASDAGAEALSFADFASVRGFDIDAAKGLAALSESDRLIEAYLDSEANWIELTEARAARLDELDAQEIDLEGVGSLPEQIAQYLTDETAFIEAEDIVGERAAELGARLTATLRKGLVSQFAKGLALETFQPITGDDLIRGLLDIDEDSTITQKKLQDFWQTNVIDVVAGFDEQAAAAFQAQADEGLTQEDILATLPLVTGAAQADAAATVQRRYEEFAGLYANAVRTGLIDQVDERILDEIAGLAGSEGGGAILDSLISDLLGDPDAFEQKIGLYADAFDSAFLQFEDEEGNINTSLAQIIDPDLLRVQYADDIGIALDQGLADAIDNLDLPDFKQLSADLTNLEAKPFADFLPEVGELKDKALTADLAARQAISAAEDAAQVWADSQLASEGLRADVSTTVTEVGEAAEDIVVALGDAGDTGGEDMAENLRSRMEDFINNSLPGLVNDINKKLVFTVDITTDTRTYGTGALVRHDGGPIFGPGGTMGLKHNEVPVIAQQGEFMIQRDAVRALMGAGVDLNALNQAHVSPISNVNNARTINNEVHVHTNTQYPETHGSKVATELEILSRRNF